MSRNGSLREVLRIDPNVMAAAVVVELAAMISQMPL